MSEAREGRKALILAIIFVAGLVFWLAFLSPFLAKEEPAAETEPIETSDGEVVGANDRIQLFPTVTRENMRSIVVHNDAGTYTFYRKDETFYILGHESAQYDKEKLAQLVVDCGYTLSKTRVIEDAATDLWKYGLAAEQNPAYYTLTTTAGDVYTVYVGDEILSGAGYYVRCDGRDTVYVLDTTLETTVLSPIESLITPLLAYPSTLTTYHLVRDFSIIKDGELFVSFEYLDESKRSDTAAHSAHGMTYPAAYNVSDNLDSALQTFIEFKGTETLKLGITAESLKKYGLDAPKYTISLVSAITDKDGNATGFIPNVIAVSERMADGSFVVASTLYDIIAKVDGATLPFVEWSLDMWVSNYIFATQIDLIASVTVESPDFNETFTLSGTGTDLIVYLKSTGEQMPTVGTGKTGNDKAYNFRQLYKMFMNINMDGTAALTDAEKASLIADAAKWRLSATFTYRDGRTMRYDFYQYSDRRMLYTLNGKGEFYVLRTMVNKFIADAERVATGVAVNADDKY